MDVFRSRITTAEIRHQMEVKAFRVACGDFIGLADIKPEEREKSGIALVPEEIAYEEGMFAARLRGESMEPKIRNGSWGVFHSRVIGTRQNRIVLVEDQGKRDGDRSTLKKYHSRKIYSQDGAWEHDEILLLPLNRGYEPIRLEEDGDYQILGWFMGAVDELQRVEPFHCSRVAAQ